MVVVDVVLVVPVAVADGDNSGHGHGLLRLSRGYWAWFRLGHPYAYR